MPKLNIILPDFIIIGANKAGTTSIADYLNQNPYVKISDVKEPMFFSSTVVTLTNEKENASLSAPYHAIFLEEYSKLFEQESTYVKQFGEASTSYMACPYLSAPLIKKLVPDVKIIAIIREPVDRFISAYKMCLGNGIETRKFHDVVKDEIKNTIINKSGHGVKNYALNGLYSQLLKPYTSYFSKKNLLILNYGDLKKDTRSLMKEIYKFLNLDFYEVDFEKKLNMDTDHIKDEINFNEEDLELLHKYFEDDIERLKLIVDFDINSWKR